MLKCLIVGPRELLNTQTRCCSRHSVRRYAGKWWLTISALAWTYRALKVKQDIQDVVE